MKPIQFPYLGNSLIMAVVILAHVFLAFIAVGGILISFISEYIGYKRKSSYHDLLAKKYISFISNLMKIGGVLGVTIVILTIGLFPEFAKSLYNIFFWFLVLEAGMFLLLMAGTIYYRESWDKAQSKRKHLLGGLITAIAAVLAGFIINAAHAFMLTPGSYYIAPLWM
ncbi:MAG: cytochrome ubiquinol oxidase subunit I [Acidobacteriota bacterium]